MGDPEIAALVDRIVAGARIPRRREREDLRRELHSHFEECARAADAAAAALGRFGGADEIAGRFAHVYRRDYALAYAAKVLLTIGASIAGVLAVELAASVRVSAAPPAWYLAPGLAHAAALGVAVGIVLVLAAEAVRTPFNWLRTIAAAGAYAAVCAIALVVPAVGGLVVMATALAVASAVSVAGRGRTIKIALTFLAFATVEYAAHARLHVPFDAVRALEAGAVLAAVWGVTTAVVDRVERRFADALTGP